MSRVRPSEILWKTAQFFLLMLFLLISLIPCFISNFDQEEQASPEKRKSSEKVLGIMARYQWDNQEIYEAIMATFAPLIVANLPTLLLLDQRHLKFLIEIIIIRVYF